MNEKPLPPVLVTRRLAPGVTERLAASCAFDLHDDDLPMGRAELLKAVRGRSAVITTLDDVVDGEFLDAAGPGLRIVANQVGVTPWHLPGCGPSPLVTRGPPWEPPRSHVPPGNLRSPPGAWKRPHQRGCAPATTARK